MPEDKEREFHEAQIADIARGIRQTVEFDPRELLPVGTPSWPLVVAAAERAAKWGPLSVRLGAIAMLIECCHAMALPNAPRALIEQAQEFIDALREMSWER